MTAVDAWFTDAATAAPVSSPGIRLSGRKLGIRWGAKSQTFPPSDYPTNAYQIAVWGSADGASKTRVVEALSIGPHEMSDCGGTCDPIFFYQGSISGLTVPFPYAIVEFANKTGADLATNAISVWVADAEPLDVKVPVQGFWGTLIPHGTPNDSGSSVHVVGDYARVIRFLDVSVFIDQPGALEFYERSWKEARPVSRLPVQAKQQSVVRFQRGGAPTFTLLLRNDSPDQSATCEIVVVARHE